MKDLVNIPNGYIESAYDDYLSKKAEKKSRD